MHFEVGQKVNTLVIDGKDALSLFSSSGEGLAWVEGIPPGTPGPEGIKLLNQRLELEGLIAEPAHISPRPFRYEIHKLNK